MAKHSPGPWHLGEDGVIVADGTGDPVGTMVPRRSILAEACRVRADRILQAQAPEMLKVLQRVRDLPSLWEGISDDPDKRATYLAVITIITEAGGAV